MVYVPFLKIDLPEPRLEDIIPGTVHVFIKALTAIFDFADDLLRPLSPAGQQLYDEARIASLPREIRLARKKIAENKIDDPEKQSEEIEDAAFAYYRRRLRETIAGYSDEETEDETFRRLVDPSSPSQQVWSAHVAERVARLPPEALEAATAAAAAAAASPEVEALQQQHERRLFASGLSETSSSKGAMTAGIDTDVQLPSAARRAVATTAAGGAGLMLGVGIVKVLRLLTRPRRGRQQRQQQRTAITAQGQPAGKAGRTSGVQKAGGSKAGSKGPRSGKPTAGKPGSKPSPGKGGGKGARRQQ